jgi:dolichyl-diphosphooligosaccharide--protein glycosyltransferase
VVINGKQRIPIRGLDLITNTGTKRGVWNNNSILFAVMNQLSNELYLMDATLYRSMLVQMLIGNPEQFKDYFELVVEHYPWTRAYKVK